MRFLELVDRKLGAFAHKHWGIAEHQVISLWFILDFAHFGQGFVVFFFVDEVDDHSVIPIDHLRILNALVNLAVTLQNLEHSLHVHVVFVLVQERVEILLFGLKLMLQVLLFLFWKLIVIQSCFQIIKFVQLQFNYPSAEQQLLGLALLLVGFPEYDYEHVAEVVDQAGEQIFLDKSQSYLFESFWALGVVRGGFPIFFL